MVAETIEAPPKAETNSRKGMGPVGWVVLAVVLIGGGIGGYNFWNYLQSFESTDDAQIDGDIYPVTSRITGTIKAVHVQDNQLVKAGDVLVELDPTDFSLEVEQAKAALAESQSMIHAAQPNVPLTSVTTAKSLEALDADLAAGKAQIATAQRQHEASLAQIRQAEADAARAQADLARYKQLVAKEEISRQQFDQADAAAKAAAALVDARKAAAEAEARSIEQAQARLKETEVRMDEAQRTRPTQIALQTALVQSREATAVKNRTQLDMAMQNLTYTKIVAPVDGIVGRKSAEPGQQVSAGQQLMSLVQNSGLWVTANFKENQLKRMHPGQRVTLRVDAYEKDYEGTIESVAGASGARFSLLPPENATGNYVKVVQRVPVRIRLKDGQDPQHILRPGLSVEPKVWLDEK